MSEREKMIVRAGYNAIAERYLAWSERVVNDPRARYTDELARRLPDGARVLDLGCGAGIPFTRLLAERFEVIGVDISEAQLDLARKNVPGATFVHGDFSDLAFPDGSFDGITAFYSISHVPHDEHARLFARVAGWLTPGGLFLATLGADESPDWTGEWLGVPMFFSSHDADGNRRLLRSAGLSLVLDEVVAVREPEGEVAFLWVLARKPVE
jgi:ubiquinone/menaquinone biosynthesis C-methylase UbiE